MAADKGASTKASSKAAAQPSVPELDAEGRLDAEVAVSLTIDELRDLCRRAGREYRGMTIDNDGMANF